MSPREGELTMNKSIGIIDYGMGNLFSLKRAIEEIGSEAKLAETAEDIDRFDALILPGVGAFENGSSRLRASGMASALEDYAQSGRALLGVCLGMHLLLNKGHEFGVYEGLGLVPGEALPLRQAVAPDARIPNVNWLPVRSEERAPSLLLNGLPKEAQFYFVHSFYAAPETASVAGFSEYGGFEFCSMIARDNVFGVQFHPERSGPNGLKLLENFANL
jgi:glutamine amidotransferase